MKALLFLAFRIKTPPGKTLLGVQGQKKDGRVSPRTQIRGNGCGSNKTAPVTDGGNIVRCARSNVPSDASAVRRAGRFGPRQPFEMMLGQRQRGRDPPRGIYGTDCNSH